MDRRALECFETVARLGSVSAAATAMSVTQPAVSKQISRLETELAVRLFHRTPAGMMTTAAGQILLELGEDVLSRFERAEGIIRSRFRGIPSFRVACPHSTADILVSFMAARDAPIVDLEILLASELDGVLNREVDMAVSSLTPPSHRAQLAVATIPVLVQGQPRSNAPFGTALQVDLESLKDEWVIVPRSGVQIVVTRAMAGFDAPLMIREASTGTIAQALAANGHGYALVTEPARFGLQSLPAYAQDKPLEIVQHASWDANHYASDELRRLARDLRQWMTDEWEWRQRKQPNGQHPE
ncbi:LysR family transcriptional regulator [Arthrobacter sp. Soil761]|uniref:LysR family transcriptional regulator n=1 Tax=Arthrobacter sp. Soil761 TaxID=1736400 RepID=UPI0006F2CA5E|nr:LysR family transcriptional regulator [Arthrobacter sp. Soil761]